MEIFSPLTSFPMYMPLSVKVTTFKKEKVKQPIKGFGVLVPSKEQQNGLKTLGTLFSSMMFPDRAPSDLHLFVLLLCALRYVRCSFELQFCALQVLAAALRAAVLRAAICALQFCAINLFQQQQLPACRHVLSPPWWSNIKKQIMLCSLFSGSNRDIGEVSLDSSTQVRGLGFFSSSFGSLYTVTFLSTSMGLGFMTICGVDRGTYNTTDLSERAASVVQRMFNRSS
ncbi:hypothetical protein ACFE04_027211 [Oxalis oulophora]